MLMAAGRCAANQSSPTPRKLVLIGGPIDPFSSPRKDAYINPSTLRALVKMSLVAVPWPYPGRGRIVFPLALRALALAGYACFGVPVPGPFRDNFLRQFGASDPFIPFHEVYATLVDLHGAWLLETLEKVFADPPMEGLWREPWVASGALAGTDIVAIEGELDDIAPPGQTAAALTLCASSKAARENPVIPGAGHFDLFSGPLWQDRVAPIVRDALHS
ncbi:MAG: hypothetical protein JJ970_15025 [Erythrobacter sp.]|nr:hypothetical protein [Erythrobacter sp.]